MRRKTSSVRVSKCEDFAINDNNEEVMDAEDSMPFEKPRDLFVVKDKRNPHIKASKPTKSAQKARIIQQVQQGVKKPNREKEITESVQATNTKPLLVRENKDGTMSKVEKHI